MNKKVQTLIYLLWDYLSASAAWGLFYVYRKRVIEQEPLTHLDENFYKGIVLVPFFWLTLYFLSGYYKNIFRKSRLKELFQTVTSASFGCLILFFVLLLDDRVNSYKAYYDSFFTLFALQFGITALGRLFLLTHIHRRIQQRKLGFNTLLVGSNKNAFNIYADIENQRQRQGYRFIGFVHLESGNGEKLKALIPDLGPVENIREVIRKQAVEEVIIAIESSEHGKINSILNELQDCDVIVKIMPDMYDILSGSVKMTAIFGAPLIEISRSLLPVWQEALKRIMDIFWSIFVLFLLFPLFLITAIIIKLTSKGPIFYSHERIGRHGNPFTIYKFRSMYVGAENDIPLLSSSDDKRVTRFGRFMRRTRLDELPQFYNVLIGDMSIVGPRPEREYFINRILECAPHYRHLHKVRPGITSWGQVKYGYAENVDQMVDRLKFDIMYIENMSLALDVKILLYTIITVMQGRGK